VETLQNEVRQYREQNQNLISRYDKLAEEMKNKKSIHLKLLLNMIKLQLMLSLN
jgi:hypothetical protein